MSIPAAVNTIESQLAYWRHERAAARLADDHERVARCEKFIAQCELVLSALRDAQTPQQRPHEKHDGADRSDRFA
jgi:hypothetical protein